jgi:ethanolaminephosphotransferase
MAAEAGERLPIWLQHIPHSWSWAITLVTKARLSFGVMGMGFAWYTMNWTRHGEPDWVKGTFPFLNLFLLGQMRYVNIPLFLLFEMQRWLLEGSTIDKMFLAMSCLWMQHVSFFALGNSNSLSSIDLSNAYNGISSYSIPLVGALTFISNWAGPIWWLFAAVRFFATKQSGGDGGGGYVDWIGWSALFHGIGMVFLVGACIVLRTHLFIWTVFSPKFLFQAVWMGLTHIFVEAVVGGILC